MGETYEERVEKIVSEFRSLSDEELDEMRGIHRIKDFNGTLREFPSTGNVFQWPPGLLITRSDLSRIIT